MEHGPSKFTDLLMVLYHRVIPQSQPYGTATADSIVLLSPYAMTDL